MPLRKVISGAQTGADQAGLLVGRLFGLETGGMIPRGHRTLTGPRPDLTTLYGLTENASDSYVPRTFDNAKNSDATVRLAGDFSSRGEICTLRALQKYSKPYFDVDLSDPPPVEEFVAFLRENNVEVLNVAGNAEQTYLGAYTKSSLYLIDSFFLYGLKMRLTGATILSGLNLDPDKHRAVGPDGILVGEIVVERL